VNDTRPRGNALIIVLIGIAVLMLLVAGAIRFTGDNRVAATSKARADELQACADTAKKLLLSRLRTFGVPATGLTFDVRLPNEPLPANQAQLRTGHIGATGAEPTIVKLDATAMGSSRYQVRDMANTLAATTLGGEYYRVVVSCRHPDTGASSELEFTFRHGL
jgi:hypothetical protein